jgi:hypothetical protein
MSFFAPSQLTTINKYINKSFFKLFCVSQQPLGIVMVKHNMLEVGENHQTLIMFCHKIVIKIYLHANVGFGL